MVKINSTGKERENKNPATQKPQPKFKPSVKVRDFLRGLIILTPLAHLGITSPLLPHTLSFLRGLSR